MARHPNRFDKLPRFNYHFTSGDPNALRLENSARRFWVRPDQLQLTPSGELPPPRYGASYGVALAVLSIQRQIAARMS